MLTLRLTFPWGRFYAHPWGQNPARITEAEWPPSPWRLLRSIAAAWFQANPGREPSDELAQTLETLGRELPTFVLPKVSFSRAIHYQPNYGATSKEDASLAKYKRVRHENHFAAVGGDVLVQWQLNDVDERTVSTVRGLLGDLVGRISYFGRAESVCELQIEDNVTNDEGLAQVALQQEKPCRRIDSDCRDVFCPNPNDFRASDLWKRRSDTTPSQVALNHFVQELLDAPQPLPDGAAWYSYRMPDGWPERWVVRHPAAPRRRSDRSRIVAHFLEFSLQCRIPVPVRHVVSIATLFRESAIRNHREPSFALSGHDRPEGVTGDHLHAFYLPIPDPNREYLNLLRVACRFGFTQREVESLMSVEALRWAGGRFPVRPVLLQQSLGLPNVPSCRTWRSLTPFVPPRYWYRHRIAERRLREPDSPERQLLRCLKENGTLVPCCVTRESSVAMTAWDACKVHVPSRVRANGSEPDHRIGLAFQLEFAETASLPLPALGHSCHFGLGQFVPADLDEDQPGEKDR